MYSDVFMHYFKYGWPDNVHKNKYWLERLPRKLKTRVIDSPNIPTEGWGIHVIEGPNRPVIFWITMGTVFASIIAGVLWSSLHSDIQGGMGLGSMIIAVPPVIMAAFLFKLTGE